MANGSALARRVATRARTLHALVRSTQRALHDVADILPFDPEVPIAVQEIGNLSARLKALVILGTSAAARVRLLHCLLGRRLLPDDPPRGCRWVRIQYGISTQVHLTLGNSEFELVEELECNKKPWDTLPVEDLIRQDHTDLATMLEVELNIPFLKDGLRIIVPPDIDSEPGTSNLDTLKKIHADLYSKRDLILRNFNPVFLYAIDRIGKNVFSENFVPSCMVNSRSEEDFWNTFNLYYMTRANGDRVSCDKCDEVVKRQWKGGGGPAVFCAENCLDLYQVKDINPNAQFLFVLFSDSTDVLEENRTEEVANEATESTEDTVYSVEELPESDQGLVRDSNRLNDDLQKQTNPLDDRRQLEEQIAFMNELLDQWENATTPPPKHHVKSQTLIIDDSEIMQAERHLAAPLANAIHNATEAKSQRESETERVAKSRAALLHTVMKFSSECLQNYLLEYCTKLSEVHVKLLQQFILASFDMARELQVVPKKIQYVATQEQQLYEAINKKFTEGEKKQELLQLMQEVLQEMKTEVNNMDWSVDDLPWHRDRRFHVSNSVFYSCTNGRPTATASDGEEAESWESYNFDDYEIIHEASCDVSDSYRAKQEEASSLTSQVGSIRIETESEPASAWLGTDPGSDSCTNSNNISFKQASLDVQQTVLSKLSCKISRRLVNFVDCLKDSYFGTLQRCVESLESSCWRELGGRRASEAVRQVAGAARRVHVAPCAAASLLGALMDSLRRLCYKLRISGTEGGEACCVLSPAWRRQVALNTVTSLAPHRLARIISHQILERLSVAHERYQSALTSLETALANRLHHTEDTKLAIRKKYAPSFARLCLESTSMCDLFMYGTPELGREIGRGQYGVVYAVRGSWAGVSPAAVKSVLPADERHYHELAMEFFYTRSIPRHPRVVRLVGSLVQRGGGAPGVLLVSERKLRDLHSAVRDGLTFAARMRVSCDIVEGIRYLHSFGLVHRDIKMKNVLLDHEDRAALSDLGFCAAEALISGSVVGTPVHMAPELLAGEYDATVDVYAFGILFWYVCAGNIKLPSAFEMFRNKEQLWSKVKKGLRPERLPHFSDECWEVMESCWASEPSQRAHLGDIQPKLEKILEQALRCNYDSEPYDEKNTDYLSDDESLFMTGVEKYAY